MPSGSASLSSTRPLDANGLADTLARLGLTQAAAGELLGVEQSTISRWLNGERSIPPPVAKLLLLVEKLGLKKARKWTERRAA